VSTSREEAERRIGTTVANKWRLDALIGYSSVAATYRAQHRTNGLDAAIKIIHRSHGSYAVLVERFLKEAHLANMIDHPGVERVFDDGVTEDGCSFLVMELLIGETLEMLRVRKGGLLPLTRAQPIFDGMLDALVAVHAAGIVHRNLKPANVFLSRDGRIVLMDFGRARLSEGDPQSTVAIEGMVVGAPAYMSPEQARGRRAEIDERSDIWSAGAIMFTTLAGRRVHEAESQEQRLELAQTQHAPELAKVTRGLPPALCRNIDRALAFDRWRRWDSSADMRRAYWFATGRDASSLPEDRPPRRNSAELTAAEEVPDTIRDAPDTIRDPFQEAELMPPPVALFVETGESAATHAKRFRKRKHVRRTLAFVAGLLIAAGAGWLVALLYEKDEPARPKPAMVRDDG
jgi:serine/threonine protein kinase